MPEQPSPVLSGVTWAQCTCPRCTRRRVQEELADGCPCEECQPGSGIDFSASLGWRSLLKRKRLQELIQKNDLGGLTPEEEEELDDLCHSYLYGG
jgi:reverse gyrase